MQLYLSGVCLLLVMIVCACTPIPANPKVEVPTTIPEQPLNDDAKLNNDSVDVQQFTDNQDETKNDDSVGIQEPSNALNEADVILDISKNSVPTLDSESTDRAIHSVLSVFLGGGGATINDCLDTNTVMFIPGVSGMYVRICTETPVNQEYVTIQSPDGQVLKTGSFEYQDQFSGGTVTDFCFDRIDFLQEGTYKLLVEADTNQGLILSSEINHPQSPQLQFGGECRDTFFIGASGQLENSPGLSSPIYVEGEKVNLIYTGFEPLQTIKSSLYLQTNHYLTQGVQPGPYYKNFPEQLVHRTLEERRLGLLNQQILQVNENGTLQQTLLIEQLPKSAIYFVIVSNEDEQQVAYVSFIGLKKEDSNLRHTNPFIVNPNAKNSVYSIIFDRKSMARSISLSHPRLSGLLHIPSGEFIMGSNLTTDSESEAIEQPAHSVFISDFWIERSEVSNAQYWQCVNNGSCTKPNKESSATRSDYYESYDEYPIINVTHQQASTYCEWAGGRLPTEAEWEKAARAGDGRRFAAGITQPAQFLYLDEVTSYPNLYPYDDTASVFVLASENALYGMEGNVWEWTSDWFNPTYYSTSPVNDPQGPETGTERVVRGGSWSTKEARYLRTTNRHSRNPSLGYETVGFRCVTNGPVEYVQSGSIITQN
jgi:sulfatase modifying factor 1